MSAFGKETSFGLVGMSAFDPKRGGLVSDGARRHNFHYFNKDVMLSAMELLMDEQARLLDKTAIACGLLALAMGLFIVLSAFGIIPSRGSTDGERWIGVIAGMASFLADLPWSFKLARGQRRAVTCLLPRRFGSARRFVCCRWPSSCRWGAIGTWVAFGPGERKFSSSIPFLPAWLNEPIGRTVFGTGAILIWIILIVMAVVGARRLRGPKE